MIVGYGRCSASHQDLAPQIEALRAAGAEAIYSEHESGVRRDRPQLEIAVASLKPGDLFVVTKIDRLARSLVDFCNIVERVKATGAAFRSIHDAVDTSTPMGRALMGILAVFAELERTRILERTGEGRRRAQAAGIRFGPRPKLSAIQIAEARRRVEEGETPTHLAKLFNVSRQTISRACGAPT